MWTERPVDFDRLTDVVRERLWDRYTPFRSVAVRGDDGTWYWEEREGLRIEDHITRVRLPKPGDDAALQALIGAMRTVPLDRERPLWQVVCVDGYGQGSAVIARTHHSIADGIRMVQLAMSLFDGTAKGGPIRPPAIRKRSVAAAPGRSVAEQIREGAGIAVQALGRAAAGATDTTRRLASESITNPLGAAHSAGTVARAVAVSASTWLSRAGWPRLPGSGPLVDVFSAAPGDADFARKLLFGTRNDTTIWTGTAGTRKAVAWSAPLPLADVRAAARAHGVTINDVLVTCVAGSLHTYLARHGAVCAAVNFMIPVNLKPLDEALPDQLGNSFALVQLELPTDNPDPLGVLEVVRRRMGRIKRGHEAALAFGLQRIISGLNRTLYQASVDLLANRAVGVLTNVPGPPKAVYFAGQKLAGMVGWAPLSGNQPMSFTIYSYDGKVFVGIACDADLVPDHAEIVSGFADAFHAFQSTTR
jgi:diacylglycerol O-acyltransferase